MVIINEAVRDVLRRVYLVGIAYNGEIPKLYFQSMDALERLDKSVASIPATAVNNAPFTWKRDKVLVLSVGRLMFSYERVNQDKGEVAVIVHEVAENGVIVTEAMEKAIQHIIEFNRRLSAISSKPNL